MRTMVHLKPDHKAAYIRPCSREHPLPMATEIPGARDAGEWLQGVAILNCIVFQDQTQTMLSGSRKAYRCEGRSSAGRRCYSGLLASKMKHT